MLKLIRDIPRFVVSFLLVAAIVNLLIGVFLRYVMIEVTDWLDVDPIRFTWVEEVGEMLLAWLTLIGAAVGIQQRAHFTLHVFTHKLSPAVQLWVHRFNHALIVGVGLLAAWYGYQLCLLNRTLATPGLQLNLAWLYASAVAGGILIALYGLAALLSSPPQGEPLH